MQKLKKLTDLRIFRILNYVRKEFSFATNITIFVTVLYEKTQ